MLFKEKIGVTPLQKFAEARKRVAARVAPVERVVVEEDSSDEEKTLGKASKGQRGVKDVEGDQDLVEDFELSEEEEEDF